MFNKRLREMRMLRKLTQQRFADMLNIALNTYQKYEQGERCPSLDCGYFGGAYRLLAGA